MNLYLKFLINFFWILCSVVLSVVGILIVKPINKVVGIIMLVAGIISFIAWFSYVLITNPELLKQQAENAERKKQLKRKLQCSSQNDEFSYIDGKKDAKLTLDEVNDIDNLLDD